ncbi:MAG: hypothetical protein JWR87_3482 [Segetibacter sp.]|jgi:hypothetical protein|nr:hypothetical protein [Segetibacter sp.]
MQQSVSCKGNQNMTNQINLKTTSLKQFSQTFTFTLSVMAQMFQMEKNQIKITDQIY